MPLYLGLDSSTQSLTAIVIEITGRRRELVFESSLVFDEALPHYGTRGGVLPRSDPSVAVSSPVMWAEAFESMLARVAQEVPGLRRLAAVSGSAQQHGSVYMNRDAAARLGSLDPVKTLASQVPAMLSRPVSPIWMDASTSAECAEIAEAVGGQAALAAHTGSRAFERFTGPQIRKLLKHDRQTYLATGRIHLVSSYLASLLAGRHAPLDPGDASGMNLMDLATGAWWPPALAATAPELESRLPGIVPPWTIIGGIAPFWQQRIGLPDARVVVWSGDNPCSAIGTGLVREGQVTISLGTSDTIFGAIATPRVDPTGTGHVFGAPTGECLTLTCFSNGSIARERVRDRFGLTWDGFSQILRDTPAGNFGRILLPWFDAEITPFVERGGVRRYGLDEGDREGHVRGVVEAQMMAMALHSRWMGVAVDRIAATGGASANREILQVMADVFGAEVYRLETGNSAALGAALRAYHADSRAAGGEIPWEDVIAGFVAPVDATRVVPDPRRHEIYRALLDVYAACEAHARGRGPDPAPLMDRFRERPAPASSGPGVAGPPNGRG
jgi:xylulokinase